MNTKPSEKSIHRTCFICGEVRVDNECPNDRWHKKGFYDEEEYITVKEAEEKIFSEEPTGG